ncbi:hypothetical protein Ctob_000254 [Chrysochromulina tobinii]|uniref:Vacuolar protein 8 n=1 Tax=Chrysochromulina tobinii TaxID=1460289 RepID=A0A0M0JHC6_9EUKA|nr:hypothetical protein Ctob_000254 [Chrysochromulina tobinii]|eukprot:KOO25991.1 hypothetical protein Ctob_000254 [Chrysochromulina sp. CCMP291]
MAQTGSARPGSPDTETRSCSFRARTPAQRREHEIPTTETLRHSLLSPSMLKIWVPELSNQSHELVDFVSTMLIDAGMEPTPDEERPPLWLASLRSSPQEVSSIMQVLVALMRSEAVATVARASASLALARFAEYCVSAGAVGCSELGLIELLVAARAIETWCEQCGSPDYPLELRLEAARALGNLAAICDAGTAVLIEKGAVAALVRLMVSQMPAAASAIGAVGCAADADAMMIDDDEDESALAADAVAARGRSATSEAADDIRVDPSCAFPVRCVCSALQALTNLREDRSMLVALTTDACLHALLTASSFTESSFISAVPSQVASCRAAGVASWLLCLLCTEPDTAPFAIRFPGTVSAVLRHASAVSSEAQEEAAWALAAISADAEHAALLVRSPGTLPVLLELLVRPQAAVRLQSAWALANLALDPLAKRLLSERPGVVASFMCAVRMSSSMSGSSTSGERAEGEGRIRQNSEEAVNADGAHEAYDQELQQALRCLGTLLTAPAARYQLSVLSAGARATGSPDPLEELCALGLHAVPAVGEAAMRAVVHACAAPHSGVGVLLRSSAAPAQLVRMLEVPSTGLLGKRLRIALKCILQVATAAVDDAARVLEEAREAQQQHSKAKACAAQEVKAQEELVVTPTSVMAAMVHLSPGAPGTPNFGVAPGSLWVGYCRRVVVGAPAKMLLPDVPRRCFAVPETPASLEAISGSTSEILEAAEAISGRSSELASISSELGVDLAAPLDMTPLVQCVAPLVAHLQSEETCDEVRVLAISTLAAFASCSLHGDPTSFPRLIMQQGALEVLKRLRLKGSATDGRLCVRNDALVAAASAALDAIGHHLTPNSRRACGLSTRAGSADSSRRGSPKASPPSPLGQHRTFAGPLTSCATTAARLAPVAEGSASAFAAMGWAPIYRAS